MAISGDGKRSPYPRRVPHVEIHQWHNGLWSRSRFQAQLTSASGWLHPRLVSGNSSTAKSNQVQGDPHVLQAHSPLLLLGVNRRGRVRNGIFGKVLGVIISSDLNWSTNIDSITTKAARRLYLLRQLKRRVLLTMILLDFIVALLDQSQNMHVRSFIVSYHCASRMKLNAFSVVRYA